MKNNESLDSVENKETLNLLIKITETLNLNSAMIGRNEVMFAIDKNKTPQVLKAEYEDIHMLFMQSKLIVDRKDFFYIVNIVTRCHLANNILFFNIADAILHSNNTKNDSSPYLTDVRNWFLNIPLFSKSDKLKYEKIYQKESGLMRKVMRDHADKFFRAIFATDNDNVIK